MWCFDGGALRSRLRLDTNLMNIFAQDAIVLSEPSDSPAVMYFSAFPSERADVDVNWRRTCFDGAKRPKTCR